MDIWALQWFSGVIRENLRNGQLWRIIALFFTLTILCVISSWPNLFNMLLRNLTSSIRCGIMIQQCLHFLDKMLVLTASCIGRKHRGISCMFKRQLTDSILLIATYFLALDSAILFCNKKMPFGHVLRSMHITLTRQDFLILLTRYFRCSVWGFELFMKVLQADISFTISNTTPWCM